jgi:hypothetical protein
MSVNTVELQPAIRFDCNLCNSQSWHNCTLRTGMEAMDHFVKEFQITTEAMDFIQKIRNRARELDHHVPALPDYSSAVMINADRVACKTCGSPVGSINQGFAFICEECGRNNYLMPENESVTRVDCQHCGSQLQAQHFLHGAFDARRTDSR